MALVDAFVPKVTILDLDDRAEISVSKYVKNYFVTRFTLCGLANADPRSDESYKSIISFINHIFLERSIIRMFSETELSELWLEYIRKDEHVLNFVYNGSNYLYTRIGCDPQLYEEYIKHIADGLSHWSQEDSIADDSFLGISPSFASANVALSNNNWILFILILRRLDIRDVMFLGGIDE